jgi:hypothetical protein
MSASGPKADLEGMSASLMGRLRSSAFRLSASADVARVLLLLFGIGTRGLPQKKQTRKPREGIRQTVRRELSKSECRK